METHLKTATPEEIQRFMSYVEQLPNGCWFWNGARSRGKGNKKFYGTFWWNKERGSIRAHRFACEQVKGEALPDNHHREHLCRFSLCVNPEHLEVLHKDENQRRSRLPRPATTLHYAYNANGELELTLKIISPSVVYGFTESENRAISDGTEPENRNDQAHRPRHPPEPEESSSTDLYTSRA